MDWFAPILGMCVVACIVLYLVKHDRKGPDKPA